MAEVFGEKILFFYGILKVKMRIEGSIFLRRFFSARREIRRFRELVRPIERRRFDRRTRNFRFARLDEFFRIDLSRHGATLNVLCRTCASQRRFRFRFVRQMNRHRRQLATSVLFH